MDPFTPLTPVTFFLQPSTSCYFLVPPFYLFLTIFFTPFLPQFYLFFLLLFHFILFFSFLYHIFLCFYHLCTTPFHNSFSHPFFTFLFLHPLLHSFFTSLFTFFSPFVPSLLYPSPWVQDTNTCFLSANLDFDSWLRHLSCCVPDECPDSWEFRLHLTSGLVRRTFHVVDRTLVFRVTVFFLLDPAETLLSLVSPLFGQQRWNLVNTREHLNGSEHLCNFLCLEWCRED